jgi:hypothetical protein
MRWIALSCLAACAPAPEKAPEPPKLELPAHYIQANEIEVRATPDPGAPAASKLKLGDEVKVLAWKDAWAQTDKGWLQARWLGLEKPTVESLLAHHDATPGGDAKERKKWLDRAIALGGRTVPVLKRLEALHLAAADLRALEKVKKELEEARSALPTGRIAVMTRAVGAYAQATSFSERLEDLHVGDVVELVAASQITGWDGTWSPVRFAGSEAYIPSGAALELNFDLFTTTYTSGTEPIEEVSRSPAASMLYDGPVLAGYQADPHVFSRRNLATLLTSFVCSKASEPERGEEEGRGYAEIVQAFSSFVSDEDTGVRQAAAEALVTCIREQHKRLRRYYGMRSALEQAVGMQVERAAPEKKALRQLVQMLGDDAKSLLGALK